jgi:hypothetical protein
MLPSYTERTKRHYTGRSNPAKHVLAALLSLLPTLAIQYERFQNVRNQSMASSSKTGNPRVPAAQSLYSLRWPLYLKVALAS